MKMKFHLIAALLAGCCLVHAQEPAAPVSVTVPPPMDNDMIVQEVQDSFDELILAINERDVDAWSSLYSKEGFLSAIAGPDVYTNRETWVQTIGTYFNERTRQHVDVSDAHVVPLGQDLALLTSQERSEMQTGDEVPIVARHVFSLLWKKEADGWRIIHSHESWVEEPLPAGASTLVPEP